MAKALSTLKGVNPAVTVFPADCVGGVYPILRHGQKLSDRFLVEASGGTPLAPALWWVLQNICQLSETRKIVLVITDGMPDNLSTAKVAIKTMQKIGIEVYGIGISMEAVKDMLPGKSCVINGISELAPAMFGLLQKTLLKGDCNDGSR